MRHLLLLLPLFIACTPFVKTRNDVRHVVTPHGQQVDDGVKKRIVILPFEDQDTSHPESVKTDARNFLIRELMRTNRVVVVDNNDLPQDLEKYKKDGSYDLAAIANMARGLDLAAFIQGNIVELQAMKLGDQVGVFRNVKAKMQATVELKVTSAKNATLLVEERRTAIAEADVQVVGKVDMTARALEQEPELSRKAIEQALGMVMVSVLRSMDKISWEGRVALVKGDRIYINAGKISGIQLGDILRVSDKGDEIFDPENGRLIGLAPGRTKGTIEVINYFGKDGAISIIHSGGGFLENDKVELYY
ncbi:MAG: hypothetical protein KDD37_10715 [Bdellovibrionales bacterium]|nr:hypothetical protein [Bdellovibrionales bacterium]